MPTASPVLPHHCLHDPAKLRLLLCPCFKLGVCSLTSGLSPTAPPRAAGAQGRDVGGTAEPPWGGLFLKHRVAQLTVLETGLGPASSPVLSWLTFPDSGCFYSLSPWGHPFPIPHTEPFSNPWHTPAVATVLCQSLPLTPKPLASLVCSMDALFNTVTRQMECHLVSCS